MGPREWGDFLAATLAEIKSYDVEWTGASSNPAIGDGTLDGRYAVIGNHVDVWIRLNCGGTTTYGSGVWYFSLPFIPATFGSQIGSCLIADASTNYRIGVALTVADGTNRIQVIVDSATAAVSSSVPMTWVSTDALYISMSYLAQ